MNCSEVSQRYAQALFDAAKENGHQDSLVNDMKKITEILKADPEIVAFIESPLVNANIKEKVFVTAFEKNCTNEELSNFIALLAKKDRISLFFEVYQAYQNICDETNQLVRGTVRSSEILTAEERERITEEVALKTKKRVILEFAEDPDLIGGLIAEVGSYTFNDTLDSHLTRLNENLNRSLH